MATAIAGGLIRLIQGVASAAPTLIVGLFIAAIFRYYLGVAGTHKLFGGGRLRSLPQAWLVGMLLPVCSIGVIPIIREMRRMGIRPGAITAFALAAPLFNPLSLLYGLTLSRPLVIVGFALGSLAVVTILGLAWDRFAKWRPDELPEELRIVGLQRLQCCLVFATRELFGPTGALACLAVSGLFLLGTILPHGELQSSVEQLDPLAPLSMALVAVPIYATPMLTMSQLGMMFAHGNSPGAAFCLLLLGTGVNLATLWWIHANYGMKPTLLWFSILLCVVVGLAYTIERPLIPPGVEPAGHTHAFDIYTNPMHSGQGFAWDSVYNVLDKSLGMMDRVALCLLAILAIVGWATRVGFSGWTELPTMQSPNPTSEVAGSGWNRTISSRTVGLTCLGGLVAFSAVACYAYYPAPSEVLEEMRLARVELLSGVTSHDYEHALHWIPIVEEWSRKLEVGYAMRRFELRPYQRMQAYLLRQKLELLEHATEHAQDLHKQAALRAPADSSVQDLARQNPELAQELAELDSLRSQISTTSQRLTNAFD